MPKKSLSTAQLPLKQNRQSSNRLQKSQKTSKAQSNNHRLNELSSMNTAQQNHSTESYCLQSVDGLRLKIAKNTTKKEAEKVKLTFFSNNFYFLKALPKVESSRSLRKEAQRKDDRKRKGDKFVKTEEESVERSKISDLSNDACITRELDEKSAYGKENAFQIDFQFFTPQHPQLLHFPRRTTEDRTPQKLPR